MPEINGPPFYDIEYATAHHEAVTARAKAAITLLIDGPTPRNGHLARAVKTILDDEAGRLAAATDRLEEAVARHYADPTQREVSEANRQRTQELVELTDRYDRHIRSCFAQFKKSLPDFTPESDWLTMVLMPVINAPAVQQLNTEVISRSEADPTRQGYLDAMLEVADFIPEMRKGLTAQGQRASADTARNGSRPSPPWTPPTPSQSHTNRGMRSPEVKHGGRGGSRGLPELGT